jgi:glycosyltransferase involved in cell wall biosynthesis
MTVIFIYHELPHYGAGTALTNLEYHHRKNGIPTALLYLYDIKDLSFLNRYTNPIVVCNTIVSYPLVQALSNTNVPTYWYIHEWIDDKLNWLNNFNSNIFKTNITPIFVCKKSYDNYKQHIPHLNKHMIMYNGIPTDVLHMKANQFKVPRRECLTIAIIGTIEDRKNQQAFIDNVLCKLEKPVHLLLVGRIAMNLKIDPHTESITFTNHVDNAIPYIMSADIIVSYSLNEVLPIHIIESFYCKKPVIATNVGGISEMIDGVNGFLIDTNDSSACISRINELKDADLRRDIGEKAYTTFLSKFDAAKTCKLLSP